MRKNKKTSSYAGRTVDLLLLKTVSDVPVTDRNVTLDVSNVVDEPMVVSGVEKMVQRYAVSFINAIGSTKFVDGHGTNIIPSVANGLVYSTATLEAAAAEANLLAFRQLTAADDGEDTPDDERIVKSEVIGLSFSRARSAVSVSVRLESAAGDSYVYVVPVGVGVH